MRRDLQEAIAEMEDIEKRRNDLNLPLNSLRMLDDGMIINNTYGEMNPSDASINKLCNRFKLSNGHIKTLADEGRFDLISDQFNHFLAKDNDIMKLRLIDKRIKGIVGKNYQKFDDHALFWQICEYLKDNGMNYEYEFVNKDDEYTRVRFTFDETETSMGMSDEGGLDKDIVKGGFEITNSEIGMKSMGINSLVYRQVCTNGMMGLASEDDNTAIFHKRGNNFNPFSRKFMLQDGMNKAIERSNNSIELFHMTKDIILDEPKEEIVKIGKRYNLNKGDVDGIQECWRKERQMNYFGVINSITRRGRDYGRDYRNRSRLEQVANNVLEKVTS